MCIRKKFIGNSKLVVRNLANNVPCGLHAHPDSYGRLDTGVSVFLDYFNI